MNIFKHKTSGLIEAKNKEVVKESVIVGNIRYKYDDILKELMSIDLNTGKTDIVEIPKSFTLNDFRTFISGIEKALIKHQSI